MTSVFLFEGSGPSEDHPFPIRRDRGALYSFEPEEVLEIQRPFLLSASGAGERKKSQDGQEKEKPPHRTSRVERERGLDENRIKGEGRFMP
jgi:hypothetical protein